jgi:hypothetical protein
MVMQKMLAGLSTRRYPVGLEPVGLEPVGVQVTQTSSATTKSAELSGLDLVALMIDGRQRSPAPTDPACRARTRDRQICRTRGAPWRDECGLMLTGPPPKFQELGTSSRRSGRCDSAAPSLHPVDGVMLDHVHHFEQETRHGHQGAAGPTRSQTW